MSKYEQANFNSNNRISTSPERKQKPKYTINPMRFGRAVLLSAAVIFGADALINEATKTPTFSDELHSYYVESGDTVWNMAEENIENSNEVDIRDAVYYIKSLPENQEVFEDGVLQAGEFLAIPDHVEKP